MPNRRIWDQPPPAIFVAVVALSGTEVDSSFPEPRIVLCEPERVFASTNGFVIEQTHDFSPSRQ